MPYLRLLLSMHLFTQPQSTPFTDLLFDWPVAVYLFTSFMIGGERRKIESRRLKSISRCLLQHSDKVSIAKWDIFIFTLVDKLGILYSPISRRAGLIGAGSPLVLL